MSKNGARNYTLYIDNAEAEKALARLKSTATGLEQKIKDIESAGGNAAREMQRLAQVRSQISTLENSISQGLVRSLRDLKNEVKSLENQIARATDPAVIQQLSAQLVRARRNLLEYEANVLQVERAQNQLARETQGTWGKIKEAFLGSFGGNLVASAVQRAVDFVKDGVVQAVQWSLATEGVRNAFQKLNAPHLLDNLRLATRNTVSDLELMRRAVMANNFQIPLETLGTLLTFAQRRARETGESVDFMVESIVTGLSRKSPLILDNLGISVSRVNDEFKKTGDFAKAVAKVVNEELGKMGPALETNQDKVDRWKAWWQNALTAVGDKFLEAMTDIGYGLKIAANPMYGSEIVDQERLLQKLSDEANKFRERELEALDLFQQKYKSADAAGKESLLRIAKESYAATEQAQKDAVLDGNKFLAAALSARLNVWGNYFKSLETTKPDSSTIGGLKAEKEILEKTLEGQVIGSDAFKATQKRLKELEKLINDATGKTNDKQLKDDERAGEKRKRQQEQLLNQLADLEVKVRGKYLANYEKEILESQHRYEELKAQMQKYGVDTASLEQLHTEEIIHIYQKHFDDVAKAYAKANDLTITERKKFQSKVVSGNATAIIRYANDIAQTFDKINKHDVDTAQYKVDRADLSKKLKAQRELLDAQKKQELSNADLTQQEKLNIEEKYRQLRIQAEFDYYAQMLTIASSFLNSVQSVFNNLSENRTRREENEVARDRKDNDKKAKEYKKQLDKKQISQEEYDRRVEAMEAKTAAKEKAYKLAKFKRDKTASIIQANIQIAQAVLQALSSAPPPYSYILAAAAAAAGAVQLLTIKNQEPPEFGRGGLLKGPLHASSYNGLPVTNPITGQTVAFLEGGEGIMKRSAMSDRNVYTVTGIPSQIALTINSSHGGVSWDSPAVMQPGWTTYTPKAIDFSGITQTASTVRRYETGGLFAISPPSPAAASPNTDVPQMLAIISTNTQAMIALKAVITNGINVSIPLTQINNAQTRNDNLRNNSTFRPD